MDLCSKLVQGGALVDVILTEAAQKFVTPLTFRSITHRPVVTDVFDAESELSVEHVALAERADVVVIAPATAHTIAKLALGLADDALTTTVLATAAPVLVAPAMDAHMYDNPATQENLDTLKRRGVAVAGPARGRLASGLWGWGRMVEPVELVGHIAATLGRGGDLADKTIVVSAGGTAEAIDPVRVITNRSSGKMGYAIAEAARDRGAHAVLVTAPTALPDPPDVEVHHVESALEMRDAVASTSKKADALIMAAAVADFRPVATAEQKIKKGSEDTMTMELTKNPGHPGGDPGAKGQSGLRCRDHGPHGQRSKEADQQERGPVRGQRCDCRGGRLQRGHQQGDHPRPERRSRRPAPDDQVRGGPPHLGPGGRAAEEQGLEPPSYSITTCPAHRLLSNSRRTIC